VPHTQMTLAILSVDSEQLTETVIKNKEIFNCQ